MAMLNKTVDLIGRRFGQWLVVVEVAQRKYNRRWLCLCDCGVFKEVQQSNLVTDASKSCGCTSIERERRAKIKDITGNRYGKLTVIALANKRVQRQTFWCCACDCGRTVEIRGNALRSGRSTACKRCANLKHGQSGTREYKRFHPAKRYCAQNQRTPAWTDLAAIQNFYANVPEGHHVDHIVPLLGKKVSGLHVLCNLQYLPGAENCRKNNRFEGGPILPEEREAA